MKRKLLLLVMIISITVLLLPINTDAKENDITVVINGETQEFDVPPVIVDGRTLVPLRHIFEVLGAQLEWEGSTQSINATKDSTVVFLQVGNTNARINNQSRQLDVPPIIIEGRTLVPLRFVSESLGVKVDWNGTTRTATLIEAKEEIVVPIPVEPPVKEVILEDVKFKKDYVVLTLGEKELLEFKSAVEIDKWEKAGDSVELDNGSIKAIKLGDSLIKVTAKNGSTAEINVYVTGEEKTTTQGSNGFIDGFTKETENFIFYYYEREKPIMDIFIEKLESNYDRLVQKYLEGEGKKIEGGKTKAYIYDTANKYYHADAKMRNTTVLRTSSGGTAYKNSNTVKIISPYAIERPRSVQHSSEVLLHEFTHIVTTTLDKDLGKKARWLSEGISTYEANQHNTIPLYMKQGNFSTLKKLNDDGNNDNLEYTSGYFLIEFIEEIWGTDTLKKLIKSGGNIQSSLGISELEFEKRWREFVTKKYSL